MRVCFKACVQLLLVRVRETEYVCVSFYFVCVNVRTLADSMPQHTVLVRLGTTVQCVARLTGYPVAFIGAHLYTHIQSERQFAIR